MKTRQRIYEEIYYSTGYKDIRTEEFVKQEQKKLGLNNNEIKKILSLSYDWAFILFHTTADDENIRKQLLLGYMRQKKFNSKKMKEDFLDHPYIRFFNLLIDFSEGVDVYEELLSIIVIDRRHNVFRFRWNNYKDVLA